MNPVPEDQPILQFPCEFSLRIIGVSLPGYLEAIIEIVNHHVPDFNPNSVSTHSSREGKYTSVLVEFIAQSRVQVDALYIDLTSHPDVRWVL